MIVLLAFAAFLVDIAWMSVIQTEAQVASDVASRGALTAFINDRSTDGFAAREARAQLIGKTIFESNRIGGGSVEIDSAAIDFGHLRANGNFFTNKKWANAVRIDLDQVKSGGFPLFLAPVVFGTDSFNAPARSVVAYTPIDVVLCLDISRSMAKGVGSNSPPAGGKIHFPPLPGSRWLALVDSVESFLSAGQSQSPSLRVSLVTFGGGTFKKAKSPWDDTETRTETDLEFIGAARIKIDERMLHISENVLGWTTPTKEGIEEATDVFSSQSSQDSVRKVMILLSDGFHTTSSPIPAAKQALQEGIMIHTIYFAGEEGGQGPLVEIAENAGGMALNADSEKELDDAFSQILSLLSVSLVE